MLIDLSYNMLPAQKAVRQARLDGKKVILIGGGVRSGKTYCGAREAWGLALEFGGLGWIVSPTYTMSKAPEQAFREACPDWSLIRDYRRADRRYELINNATVEIKSADDPDKLRGFSPSWVWADEHAYNSEYLHNILLGRLLDNNGVLLITTTPKGRNFLYNEVYLPSLPNSPDYDSSYFSVHAKTMDNIYLDEKARDWLKRKWENKGRYAEQELEGIFVGYEGLVYDNFDEKKMVVKDDILTKEQRANATWLMGIDFGWEDPSSIHLIAKYEGIYFVWDEIYERKLELEDMAKLITDMEKRWKCGLVTRYADSSASRERATLHRSGIKTIGSARGPGDIDKGIQLIYSWIADGRLKVNQRCRCFLTEIGLYAYPDGSKNTKNKPIDAHNHAMDDVRYMALGEDKKQIMISARKFRGLKPKRRIYI